MSENFQVYLPEREPEKEDYSEYDRIEVIHLSLDGEEGNEREKVIRERIKRLKDFGIEVREVDIDTDNGDIKDAKVVVAGALGDVCAEKRRRFLLEHKAAKAIVDTSLATYF